MPICKRCKNRIELKDQSLPHLFILVSPQHTNLLVGELCWDCARKIKIYITNDKVQNLDKWREEISQ